MRTNSDIRATKIRVIGDDGKQIGVMGVSEAIHIAQEKGLDLVEISPAANPPVCKIIDYGKFRYQQSKKEKENKKAHQLIKIKEIKLKPNIDTHDLETKIKRARDFVEKGYKVKLTCMFRGREMMFVNNGKLIVQDFIAKLEDIATAEGEAKLMGRNLSVVIAPGAKKKTAE